MLLTTTTITLHGVEVQGINDTIRFADDPDLKSGIQAAASLTKHETVHVKQRGRTNDTEYIIPYHAVLMWDVTKTTEEIAPPEDAFCQPVGCDEIVTVTWIDVDGETVLGTDEVCKGKVPVYSGATPTSGGEFIGWNTETGTNTPISPLPPATADITYYAVYRK